MAYTKVLTQLAHRHRLCKKANALHNSRSTLTPAQFQLQFDKWDEEYGELMQCAEKRCRKVKTSDIAWSPVIGTYIRHLNIFRWIVRYKQGCQTNSANLHRMCRNNYLPSPDSLTLEEAQKAEWTCVAKLEDVKERAPQM